MPDAAALASQFGGTPVTPPGDAAALAAKFGGKPTAPVEQNFLDREIPLSSYGNATLSGVQSIGRGIRDAGEGAYNTVRHPIDTLESIGKIPSQVAQVPAAIHDINQSVDPLGTYAKVAQETAGQGAGQALMGLATEGIAKTAPTIARVAKPAVRGALRMASDAVDPDITGIASPRLANAQRVAGKLARKMGGSEGGAEVYRDATRQNIPYAGEEIPGENPRYRDATKLNVPYAGEDIPDNEGGAEVYRDATRQNIPYAGEEIPGENPRYRDATKLNVPYAGEDIPDNPAPAKIARPNSRLIKTPDEFQSGDQIQRIAKTRASERGMQYAAGMRPGGRKIPIE